MFDRATHLLKARFVALLEHHKAIKQRGDDTKQQPDINPNTNSEANDPKTRKDEILPSDLDGLPPPLLEVDARESLDAQQQRSESFLLENSNHKTNRDKLRRRKFRGANNN